MPLQPGLFTESLIRFLLPFFLSNAVDIDAARAEMVETLNAYGARTRAEMLTAARIIAFSMASLDTLMGAKADDLSLAMKIRYHGCANGLNRSTIQNEKALDRSLARELPPHPDPMAEPVDDLPDAEVQGAIEHAQSLLAAHRNRTSADRSATPLAHQDRNRQLWAGVMIETLKHMGYGGGGANGPAGTG